MIGTWRVRNLPRCTHHMFLSHCAEDRDRLVQPVFEALQAGGLYPWFDRNHYPKGQGAFAALREGIVRCRHIAYFVTAHFLQQGRGWNSVELAYGNLLQENLRFPGEEVCHLQLPLFFLPRNHAILQRSAWGPLVERGRFYTPGRCDADAADWAVQEIAGFVLQEQNRGPRVAEQLQRDDEFRSMLNAEPNLLRRVMCIDPPPMTE